MAKLTLDSLRKLRAERKAEMNRRDGSDDGVRIIVGMGTCGIAAGAREALNVFLNETQARKMKNVLVSQTGCLGLCHAEPTVEVRMNGMPPALYGNVDAAVAKRIVEIHLLGRKLVNGHIYDYPAQDICKE